MTTSIPLVAQADLAGQVEAIQRDGYVYLPGVLDADEIAELREAMARVPIKPESFDWERTVAEHGAYDKAVNNAFNRDLVFLKYLDYPGVIEIAEAIHTEDCHCVTMTAWVTGPGRKLQPVHADYVAVPLPEDIRADPRVHMPIFISTAHFYLDDIYDELGPTQFIPGSHMAGRVPNGETSWKGIEPQSIICNAGDVVIFRSEVWHRGTANTSNQTRYLLQVHYSNPWITTKYPPYLGKFQFDPEILARATPRQLRLMGDHKSGAYA